MIYRFKTLASSNDEASDPRYVEGDVVLAESQSCGRGQRGHSWESAEGKNLTLSVVFEPKFLNPQQQFLLSEAVALGVKDMLAEWGIEAKIKWTNDVYVGDKKVAGILIEHKLQGASLARTVAGIGLNVNQKEFPADIPNPLSMAQWLGCECNRDEVLACLHHTLMMRYNQLRLGSIEALQRDYHSSLYRLGEWHWYSLADGTPLRGMILGVEPTGALRIKDTEGNEHSFLFKEVEFQIEGR